MTDINNQQNIGHVGQIDSRTLPNRSAGRTLYNDPIRRFQNEGGDQDQGIDEAYDGGGGENDGAGNAASQAAKRAARER